MALVEVQGLRKVYPDGTEAVAGIDFQVKEAEFFGFLGPNGAGKTTTIKVLVTLIPKTEGRVVIDGLELGRADRKIRERIGYAAQDVSVDEDLTGRENLILSGRLYHMGKRDAERRADDLMELIGLADAAHKLAGVYSGGMRRRLDLAQALMHHPALLFLDEPTTGLDPQNRRAIWAELKRLCSQGTTIFLTTQSMEEADALCERLAIIDGGRIVAEGSPSALKAQLGGEVLTLEFPTDDPETLRGVIARGAGALRGVPGLRDVREGEKTVVANLDGVAGQLLPAALSALEAAGVDARLAVSTPTLDDVFLALTGHALRDEQLGKARGLMGRRPTRGR